MSYNNKNPAIRRLMKEWKDIAKDRPNNPNFIVEPCEGDLFDWHFTILGPQETPFENGRYHGRILLPPEYPLKPPSIILMTPNGRFQLDTKICLTITGFHPEFWQPSWSSNILNHSKANFGKVHTVLIALISLFPAPANGSYGGIDSPDESRRVIAKKSLKWSCPTCEAKLSELDLSYAEFSIKTSEADREFLSLVDFKAKPDEKELGKDSNHIEPCSSNQNVPLSDQQKIAPKIEVLNKSLQPPSVDSEEANSMNTTTNVGSSNVEINSFNPPNRLLDVLIVLCVALLLYLLLK